MPVLFCRIPWVDNDAMLFNYEWLEVTIILRSLTLATNVWFIVILIIATSMQYEAPMHNAMNHITLQYRLDNVVVIASAVCHWLAYYKRIRILLLYPEINIRWLIRCNVTVNMVRYRNKDWCSLLLEDRYKLICQWRFCLLSVNLAAKLHTSNATLVIWYPVALLD